MKPFDKIERQREHFENIAERYYRSRQLESHLLLKDLLWSHFLKGKDYLKKDNLLVLEPMCGYAEGKEILERHLGVKVTYTGFDYSSNLVEKVKELNPEADVFEMDITKFIPSIKYDLIIIIGGLHHVFAHADVVLEKLRGALEDSGHLICFEPTHDNFLFRKLRERIYKKNDFFDDDTEQAFELKKLNELFAAHRFRLTDQIYPGMLSYVLFYNPDAFPWLNRGGLRLVKTLFSFDKLFFRNFVGRKLSFATLSIFQGR